LANHSGGCEPVGRQLELPASVGNHAGDRFADTVGCRGVTYERLEGYKTLQWPVHADGTDEPLLFTKGFNFPDGKARFFPVGWVEPYEQVDTEFDLQLNNGRLLEHFHEGNMTYRVNGIKEKTPNNIIGSRFRLRSPQRERLKLAAGWN
jgi:predicted molibdopterin-dependent oxidoreductase YjgC